MKLLRLMHEGQAKAAIVVDVEEAVLLQDVAPELPTGWHALIAALHKADCKALEKKCMKAKESLRFPLDDVQYARPLIPANKVLCVGLNYKDHALEGGRPIPEHPVFFTRYCSSFVAHGGELVLPRVSDKYDFEAELAVVIGAKTRHVSEEQALSHVFGYTVAMDGSVRDFQRRHEQWTMGKNFDASGALGPVIVTTDELPEGARGLAVKTRINDELLQDGNTADMIFSVGHIVATLSTVMTLEAGDVIITGTPAGVGFARKPPRYLQAGDRVDVSVEQIGVLSNRVIAEPS